VNEITPPALDLRIWTTPLMLDGDCYILIAAADISDEKRRQALERIFFHDVLNTATIIDGTVKLLLSMDPAEDTDHVKALLNQVTERLIDEILTQREFVELENQQVTPKAGAIRPRPFLQGLVDSYVSHDAAKGRHIRMQPEIPDTVLRVDKALLGRVLGNLLKNAIEASDPGETITLGCSLDGDNRIEFWVHNHQVMPAEVRMQVFERSFSTKGRGRGLGTYGAKLLTERYLEGEIAFTSELDAGTTFRVRYPLAPSYADGSDGAGDAA
jgi:signal transduction histidine kinase